MWIVKNVSREPVELGRLKLTVGPKEFVDLDPLGRERAEEDEDLRRAIDFGTIRTVSKRDERPVDPERVAQRIAALTELQDPAAHPAVPANGPEPIDEDAPIGVHAPGAELRRRMAGLRPPRGGPVPAPAPAGSRQEEGIWEVDLARYLEEFRLSLLEEVRDLLEEYLGPRPGTKPRGGDDS